MKEFVMFYWINPELLNVSPEEMQTRTKKWMDWLGNVAAQGQLAATGNRLGQSGKIIESDKVVTDGPYAEMKEIISGYSIIKSSSYDEAVEIAKGCPIYPIGGRVEVREVNPV